MQLGGCKWRDVRTDATLTFYQKYMVNCLELAKDNSVAGLYPEAIILNVKIPPSKDNDFVPFPPTWDNASAYQCTYETWIQYFEPTDPEMVMASATKSRDPNNDAKLLVISFMFNYGGKSIGRSICLESEAADEFVVKGLASNFPQASELPLAE